MFVLPLLLVTSVLHVEITVSTEIYYVTPDSHTVNNYTNTLQHYVDNSKSYFTNLKDVQLHFLPGTHFLNKSFIIKKILFLTLSGNHSVIDCDDKGVGISFTNVKNFTITNIMMIRCSIKHNDVRDRGGITLRNQHAALFLRYCNPVNIINVTITVNASINGIVIVNSIKRSNILNLTVHVKCLMNNNTSLSDTNGMVLYNYDDKYWGNSSYYIFNYIYNSDTLCSKICHQYALRVLLVQSKYNTYVKISNTTFSNLHNVTMIYYYGESYVGTRKIWNIISLYNCNIIGNTGTSLSKIFFFVIHSNGYSFGNEFEKNPYRGHFNIMNFKYCNFYDNLNFKSLLHILAINTLSLTTIMKIDHCNIHDNRMVTVMEMTSDVKVLWQMTFFVNIRYTNISFNTHTDRLSLSLLSATNAIIKLSNLVTIKNNSYYYSIFMLRLSILKFYGQSEVTDNKVRHVFKSKEGSYYLINEGSKITMTHNIVFNVLSQSEVYNGNYQKMCYFQFYSSNNNLDESLNKSNFNIVMLDNIYTAPIHILNYSNIFPDNCSWLVGTAFNTAKSSDVYNRFVNRTLQSIDRRNIGIIPSSICQCVNSTDYNCASHELGTIYPGQTIHTKLIIPRLISIPLNFITLRVVSKNLPSYGCRVTGVNEISQTHFTSGCNEYSYTIWSDEHSCELYLESTDSMEIFYVDLKPCPLGFSLQKDKQACACDQLLNTDIISITSCNLKDATILRPANSWIFATKYHDQQFYKVSPCCPFDYCLPYTSSISLSTPDLQCQFKRSGVLCGYCQEGLSAVFGSSQCKQCSNAYVLIAIPIMIAGIVLVIVLFIFNITINNGVINMFIFYVNVININFSMFFPRCNSVVCVFISLANLDLGIETCFYDGMDDYAKIWLQLIFPIYLFIIVHLLIIGSRYSPRIQRLTAQKALPILATLLLLSYTKILLTVCRALFYFSYTVDLPGKHVKYIWSVDTSIELFGAKFSILFAICLIFFIMLLPFNIILLFSRTLSRFKLINYFKPLLDVYCGPYKDKYYYWTGLYLLMRAAFFGLSAFSRKVNLTCGIILLAILLCIQGIVHPFKDKLTNIQESFILLNLLSVYVAARYSNTNAGIELHIVQFLIISIFIYFAIFIFCHCLMSICGKEIRKKANWFTALWKNDTGKSESNSKISLSICGKAIRKKAKWFTTLWKNDTVKSENNPKIPLSNQQLSDDSLTGSYSEFREPLIAL